MKQASKSALYHIYYEFRSVELQDDARHVAYERPDVEPMFILVGSGLNSKRITNPNYKPNLLNNNPLLMELISVADKND